MGLTNAAVCCAAQITHSSIAPDEASACTPSTCLPKNDGKPLCLDVSTIHMAELAERRNVVVHLFRSTDNLKHAQWMVDEVISLAAKETP